MNTDEQMQSTMLQIEMEDGSLLTDRSDDLKKEILKIEHNIKNAQSEIEESNSSPYSYDPVTPEQANARLKAIVFMKKDLENKRTEIEELN
ncbi:MAG: hypothetical protein KW804_02685 [Candidatus Doudnabacteria bacterium]|nr:hypothetical protein [Candidatus Doudnabacteria bacterium]